MEEGHRITESVLRKAIVSDLDLTSQDDVEVVGFEVTGGSKRGDNFACEMKAVSAVAKIKGKEERSFNYMAKCFPMNAFRVEFLKSVRNSHNPIISITTYEKSYSHCPKDEHVQDRGDHVHRPDPKVE